MGYRVAKYKKTRSIVEELILHAAVDMLNIMVGESPGRLLSMVPLYKNTISRTIKCMVDDINFQLITKFKGK